VNTIELSANGHASLNDRTFPALEMSEPAEPTLCADIAVTAAAVAFERGAVIAAAAARLGIARIRGYDFGFTGQDAVPASVRSQDISGKSADHLIGLLTP